MILSASRRTDIPAFFSEWFYNRIQKGFVLIRNPMNIHQISKVNIRPEVVDCIVFWTKNPKPLINRLEILDQYHFYFQYTINGYGQKLEPNIPTLQESLDCFKSLSELLGAHRVIWRYDPIIITDDHSIKYHINNFSEIAQQLSGYTRKCIISFVNYYKKCIKNMKSIQFHHITEEQITKLAERFALICKRNDISIWSCAEKISLEKYGIKHGKCIDDNLIEELCGYSIKIEKDKSQRTHCHCVTSIDIGAYNTCPHGCLYCYANYDMNSVRRNYTMHDRNSELLIGTIRDQNVRTRKVTSCRLSQPSLFDQQKAN